MKRWMYTSLTIAFSVLFLVSAAALVNYWWQSRQSQDTYNDLANLVQQNKPTTAPTTGDAPTDPSDPTQETTEPPSPYVEITDPDTGETIQVLREYAELYQLNTDFVGWLRFDGTKINYPVVHKPERTDYYLRRDFYGKYDTHGCLYLREQCDAFAPTDNITIYGHHMQDGTMLTDLMKYKKKSFWETNKTFTFDTLTEHHTYEILSVFLTTATVGQGFDYHLFVNAKNEAEFNDYVATCKKLALYDTGVTATYGDKLVTLSTCEYSQINGRLVVVAKRIS